MKLLRDSDAEASAPPPPDRQPHLQVQPPSHPTAQEPHSHRGSPSAHPGALLRPQQAQQPWTQQGPPWASQGFDHEGEASSASSAPTGTLPLLEERSKRHMVQLEAYVHHKSPRLADAAGPLPLLRTLSEEGMPALEAAARRAAAAAAGAAAATCEPDGAVGEVDGEEQQAAAGPGSGASAPALTLMTLGARLNRTAGLQPAAVRPALEPQQPAYLDDCASSGVVTDGNGGLPPPGEDPFWDDIRRIFNM